MKRISVHEDIADLLSHPKVLETRQQIHHHIAKYDHLLRSVRYSRRIAPLLRADRRVCMRAALLHDIDSRLGTLASHGGIAARWAERLGESAEVCNAIVSHMYPIGPRPSSREAWVLVIADKAASIGDMRQFVIGLATGRSLGVRRQLLQLDPLARQLGPALRHRPLFRLRRRRATTSGDRA